MDNNLLDVDFQEDSDDDSEYENITSDSTACAKLQVPEYITAYLEKRELERDIEEVLCDNELKDNVMNNYIIVKRILSNLSWQDKLLCKHVCTTWHSAVLALQKEQLSPADFVVDMHMSRIRNGIKFKTSGHFSSEPLVVFAFVNDNGISVANKCMVLLPSPCDPSCEKEHCLIDYIQHQVTSPKDCMLTVRAGYLSYRPLAQSPTAEYSITNRNLRRAFPFIAGLYIPLIPDVKFNVVNITTGTDMMKDYYDVLSEMAKNNIFKGILIFVTEKFILQSFIEDCTYLNYFKEIQPDIPYALGGCIVEDTLEQSDVLHLVEGQHSAQANNAYCSENLITLGLFTVPKGSFGNGDRNNFDMYSLIIESSDWSKAKIQKTINEFSQKVPRFYYTMAFKFACVGRDQKHDVEEEYFRAAFPYTRLIGCFGNGELGINHPARPPSEAPAPKKTRTDSPRSLGILYSYSTVFVYIGWGKMTPAPT